MRMLHNPAGKAEEKPATKVKKPPVKKKAAKKAATKKK
jgi:hypothetical protein